MYSWQWRTDRSLHHLQTVYLVSILTHTCETTYWRHEADWPGKDGGVCSGENREEVLQRSRWLLHCRDNNSCTSSFLKSTLHRWCWSSSWNIVNKINVWRLKWDVRHLSYLKYFMKMYLHWRIPTFPPLVLFLLLFLKQPLFSFFVIIMLNINIALISSLKCAVCVFLSAHTRPGFPPSISSSSLLVGVVLLPPADTQLREISVFSPAACESEPRENRSQNIKPIFETVPRFCQSFKCAI